MKINYEPRSSGVLFVELIPSIIPHKRYPRQLTILFLFTATGTILAALLTGRLVVGTDATTLQEMTFASADTIFLFLCQYLTVT